ncbi:hypothetical protein EW183_21355 [Salmonella enterica]|nr:hypothetical protein [Salmonella enterica]EDI3121060.1 hypothetical protein [Salmonella enterica subsp. enterica serovar Newport]EAR6163891.1 hypothetical protein [Salmonella enterica]EAT5800817.1 hypothetical protein [Salmonella enterica]EAW5563979.1 hypothetical protein [Salmonella enterica]
MKRPYDSYHTVLNFLVVANLFVTGLLAGGFVWLWLMVRVTADIQVVPAPDQTVSQTCRCRP